MKYNKKYTSIFLIQYHIIWCPKFRKDLLKDKIKDKLEEIIKDVCYEKQYEIKALEIMPNHVHLFVSSNPKESPYKIVKNIKGRSSNILRKQFPELLKMSTLWTRSYFISTIGNASEETIQKYIENQWNKN